MISIPPTVPMHRFAALEVKSPMQSFRVFAEVGLNVYQLISKLTAESVPAKLEVQIEGIDGVEFQPPDSPMLLVACFFRNRESKQ